MKKLFIPILLLVSSIAISCGEKPENVAADTVQTLFDCIKLNNLDSLRIIYPKFDERYMKLPSDSIRITKCTVNEDKSANVELINFYSENHLANESELRNIIVNLCPGEGDGYIVTGTTGLVDKRKLPELAEWSGYLKEKGMSNDIELIEDLPALDTMKSEILSRMYEEAAQEITVAPWYSYGKNPHNYYKVTNNSDLVIQYLSFNYTYKFCPWPSYQFHGKASVEEVYPGCDDVVDLDYSEFFETRDKVDCHMVAIVTNFETISKEITKIIFYEPELCADDYTGNEYAEYVAAHRK